MNLKSNIMKKLLILSLLSITLLNIGCNKKSSETSQSTKSSATLKCPNCSSTNVGNWQGGTDDSMQECHTCGIAFDKVKGY